ncbi:hypothetical protein HK102_009707 [Quaeritorhiza haematococci]|nr:hypothetical protein HK102_009707 [Quaeritorhiza haematococci]
MENRRDYVKLNVLYKFILTHEAKNRSAPGSLEKEAAINDDMIFVEAPEDYKKLLDKAFAFLDWVNKSDFTYTWIPSSRLLKTDDDTFVRVNGLLSYLRELKITERLHFGRFSHTWVGRCYFASIDWGYPTGAGWIMSSDVVKWIETSSIPPETDPYEFETSSRLQGDAEDRLLGMMDDFGRPEDSGLGLLLAGLKLNRVTDKRFHDIPNHNFWFGQPNTTQSLLIHHVPAPLMSDLAASYQVLDTRGCEAVWNQEVPIAPAQGNETTLVWRNSVS